MSTHHPTARTAGPTFVAFYARHEDGRLTGSQHNRLEAADQAAAEAIAFDNAPYGYSIAGVRRATVADKQPWVWEVTV